MSERARARGGADSIEENTDEAPVSSVRRRRGWVYERYELGEELAESAGDQVFQAVAHGIESFERKVVLKAFSGADDAAEQRRLRVIRSLSLSHTGIAQLLDAGYARVGDDETPRLFIVREHVPGVVLSDVMEEVGLAPVAWLHIVVSLAHALLHAYAANVRHGSINARSVLLGQNGAVKLIGYERPVPVKVDDVIDVVRLARLGTDDHELRSRLENTEVSLQTNTFPLEMHEQDPSGALLQRHELDRIAGLIEELASTYDPREGTRAIEELVRAYGA